MQQSAAFSVIEPDHPSLSIVRPCELVSISRSGFYCQPTGETAENLALLWLPARHPANQGRAALLTPMPGSA